MPFKRKGRAGEATATAVVFILIAVLVISMTYWSITRTNDNVDQAVDKLSDFYLSEMMGQREQVLEDSLSRYFEQLGRVVDLAEHEGTLNQTSARRFLSQVQTLIDVEKIALVDEESIVYTAHSTFTDASRYIALQEDFTEPMILASEIYGAKKQVVLAAPVTGVTLEGRRVCACFMQIDIDDIVGSLNYEINGAEGNAFIGLYYNNGDDLTSYALGDIAAGTNLLTFIEESGLADEAAYETMTADFDAGQQGLVSLQVDGDTEYLYYISVTGTEWMLVLLIRDNTIADQLTYTSSAMLQRNVIQVAVTAALILVVFLVIGYLNKKNSDMRIRQQELEVRAENQAALQKAYDELKVARDRADAASRAKTTFLFNMSHDIRTPMNAILGFSALMEKELDKPEILADHLQKIRESGDYLLSLINNILDMARIESGKMELQEAAMSISGETDTILHMFDTEVARKDLQLSADMRIDHPYIYADRAKIREIVSNLLSNAVKYTPAGGSIRLGLTENPADREGYAVYTLVIADTGIGMSREFQEHLFDLFSREHTTTESKVAGTGLGMSIVRRLLDLMGGTIEVESALGQGTTFTVTLVRQIAEAPETAPESGEAVQADEAVNLSGRRILLAEDNVLNAEIAIELLEDYDIRVDHAEDGLECVSMLAQAEDGYYDLILMDIQMPHLNGYEAACRIRALADHEKAAIPIIAMTANAFEEDRQNAFAAGMNGHVAKPIDIDRLLKELRKWMK